VSAAGQVEVGQRYRIVRAGGVPSTVWEVVRIYKPWLGGFEHGCLKSVDGTAETMTLTTSVIAVRIGNRRRSLLTTSSCVIVAPMGQGAEAIRRAPGESCGRSVRSR
jgi:hypothetical protein